jgi:peptide/nickel transport system permease protein
MSTVDSGDVKRSQLKKLVKRLGETFRKKIDGLIGMLRERPILIFYLSFLFFITILAVAGPMIAPYEPGETFYADDGGVLSVAEPSAQHLLGTNSVGQDVLSRLIIGARPTVVAGGLGGLVIISLGLTVGIISGYMGGYVDDVLMRITDFVYGVPLIPFAIVLVTLLGVGYLTTILVIGLILWRGSARVIRSQVMQIKQREFITSARAVGANPLYIIVRHILPNVAPMAVLFFSLGIGYTILIQAGLTFLGVADPFTPTWGVMIRGAYDAGAVADGWYWSIPPGLMISFTVLSAFMFGREYESLVGSGKGEEALAEG